MKRLTWWFRIVGAFYLLLAMRNLYFVLLNPSGLVSSIGTVPFIITADSTMALVDGWSPFAFELLAIATFMLWASRNPRRYLGAVWLLVWLELLHGVADDLYLIVRGYAAAFYIGFIVIHLIIVVTGVLFARQAEAETVRSATAP